MDNALKRSNSHIYRAIIKNGHAHFSLTILEYCSPEKCIEREDFYLSTENHEYNILEKAGSRLGSKHSDESIIIMSDAKKGENNPMFGKNHTEETKTILSDVNTGENNPMFGITGENHPMYGKNHSDDTKKIISDALKGRRKNEWSGKASQQIEVTDTKNNTTVPYNSISEAARALNIQKSVIDNYFNRNQKKPYKGQYTFKKI